MDTMGETGEGLTREELEGLQVTNRELYNKWGTSIFEFCTMEEQSMMYGVKAVIKDEFPWYTEVRDLIGNRPNTKPVGIGNSKSPVDMSILSARHVRRDSESDSDCIDDGQDDVDFASHGGSTAVHSGAASALQAHTPLFDDDEALYAPSPAPSIFNDDGVTNNHDLPAEATPSRKHKSLVL